MNVMNVDERFRLSPRAQLRGRARRGVGKTFIDVHFVSTTFIPPDRTTFIPTFIPTFILLTLLSRSFAELVLLGATFGASTRDADVVELPVSHGAESLTEPCLLGSFGAGAEVDR